MQAVQPLNKFNLLYHVAPMVRTDVWRRNLKQLVPRLGQFNGRKVVSIMTGPDMAYPHEVKEFFAGHAVDFLEIPNAPHLRERVSFFPLLRAVESLDPGEASFFAHAKGVATVGNATGVMYWRNLMYQALLDQPARVRQALRQYPIVGSFRKNRPTVFRDGVANASWHFAGTFFWFRHDAFFSRPWNMTPETGWAVEACPGTLFRHEESYCLVKDNVGDPYHPSTYAPHERITDDEGSAVRVQSLAPPLPPEGLSVELGGGPKPLCGYVNVDRCATADVVFDFETLSAEGKLPFETDSVARLYTSHCIEHIRALRELLREMIRICKVGAVVEIRVPHYLSNMAMCYDHKHVIGHEQIEHWTTSALAYWWGGLGKSLRLHAAHSVQSQNFARWRTLLPHASDQDILDLCPDASHENRWIFTVVPWDG